jgi:hypothetical protein
MPDMPRFQVGDRVRVITHTPSYVWGKVIGLRGPLGPGGAQVYRLRLAPKRPRAYVEVLADQLELLPPTPAKS